MAKETKKGADKINLQTVNEDNVYEQVDNAGKFGDDIVKAAAEKKADDDKKRAVEEFSRLKDRAGYTKMSLVGRKKYSKDCDNILGKVVKDLDETFSKVEAGEMSAEEYGRELDRIVDEQIKEINKARKKYDDYKKALERQFPHSWYDWDNPSRRIATALRSNA